MVAYIVRRSFQSIFVLIGVSIICFFVFQFLGDPVLALVGQQNLTQKRIEQLREKLGFNDPLYVQYGRFLLRVFHGNLGRSYVRKRPVTALLAERLPATAELVVCGMLFASFFGVVLGVLCALKPDTFMAKFTLMGSLVGISTPTFLIGLFSMMIFSYYFRVLPPFGRGETITIAGVWPSGLVTFSGIKHIILPATTLGLYQLALILRLTRSEVMEKINKDYARTAWAKGAHSLKVYFKHVLRNALIPIVTIIGLQSGMLLGFSIVTETIFQWPGLGRLLIVSLYQNDRPVIIAYLMFIALIIVSLNLSVDAIYSFLDPRIEYH